MGIYFPFICSFVFLMSLVTLTIPPEIRLDTTFFSGLSLPGFPEKIDVPSVLDIFSIDDITPAFLRFNKKVLPPITPPIAVVVPLAIVPAVPMTMAFAVFIFDMISATSFLEALLSTSVDIIKLAFVTEKVLPISTRSFNSPLLALLSKYILLVIYGIIRKNKFKEITIPYAPTTFPITSSRQVENLLPLSNGIVDTARGETIKEVAYQKFFV